MGRRVFVCLALAIVLLGAAPSTASAQCGGSGEVPCYHWDRCAWKLFGIWCMGWWVPDAGTVNGCDTDRYNNIGLVCADCGGTGQPSCGFGSACTQSADQRRTNAGLCWACGQEGQVPCDPGAGDPCDLGYRNAFGLCHYSGHSAEPTTNTSISVPTQTDLAKPLYGYAEIHIHPFANLAFGGATTWGAPYDSRGIDAALPWCDYSWEYPLVSYNNTLLGTVSTLGWEIHGPNGIQFFNDPMEGTIGMGEHPVGGTGPFDGWPKWNSITHQQAYHKWMERAYQGGMRLMVMLAVTNEALCRSSKRRLGWSCDDMEAVDRQIAATKELEAAIDRMAGGAGEGWFRIAYSPQQARQIIRDGKMAVILGIEVDSLFGCKVASEHCTDTYLRQQIARYYNMGVRHIYPIHGFDNAFGGAALFNDEYNYANRIVNGYYFLPYDCSSEDFGFNLSEDFTLGLAQFFLHGIGDRPYDYDYSAADCNPRPLTDTGRNLINALMDAKMIIDIDHMSLRMLEGANDTPGVIDGALEIAEARDYPVVSSHASFNDLNKAWDQNEFYRTPEQLERIMQIGGIVAPFPPTKKCNTSRKYPDIWRYIMPKMTGGEYWSDDDGVIGVALATDMMGATQETAPRFGQDASGCPNDLSGAELHYPFEAEDDSGLLWPQVTGGRTFNFNYDGLAHIGLVPDLLADIRQGPGKTWGMTSEEMAPIFKSAEAYIRMWERIQASDVVPPPAITADVEGTQGPGGWYTSAVTVTWSVQSQTSYTSSGCEPMTITWDTPGDVLRCEAANEGGGESSASVTIRRDTTPPVVTGAARVTEANPDGWNNAAVVVRFTASDETSGIAGDKSVYVTVGGESANQQARYTFRDRAGNTTKAALGGINIDRTPPRLGFRFENLDADATLEDIQAEQTRWHREPVVLIVAAEDDLSGLAPGSPAPEQIVLAIDGLAVSGSATATDRAGNSVTASSEPVKIDRTPPTIAFASRTPANAAGWNRGDVDVQWACADTLSGVVSASVTETISSEGENQQVTGVCLDVAGNQASATETGINIDKTAPTLDFDPPQPPPSAYLWHRGDVSWFYTERDDLSGVASTTLTSPLVVSGEGVGLTASVTVTDVAENAATFSTPPVRIDRTPPSIELASRLPGPNAYGWNNYDITVTWLCGDTLSGVVDLTVSQTLSAEGAGQSLTGRCLDRAANEATGVQSGLSLDKTAPSVAAGAQPPPNAAGWNNSDVTVTFEAVDRLSGVVGASTASVILTTEGVNLGAAQTFADRAGNETTTTIGGIKLDKTPPVVACVAAPGSLWPANHTLAPVAVDLTFTDALSRAAAYALVAAASSEPDNGLGDGDTAGDVSGFVVGSQALAGSLRAERGGGGSGRVYTLGYRGLDVAGNAAECRTTVLVPHDQGSGAGKKSK